LTGSQIDPQPATDLPLFAGDNLVIDGYICRTRRHIDHQAD
jgi:hypothetical protein